MSRRCYKNMLTILWSTESGCSASYAYLITVKCMENERKNTLIYLLCRQNATNDTFSLFCWKRGWLVLANQSCDSLRPPRPEDEQLSKDTMGIHEYMEVTRFGSSDRVMAIPPSVYDRLVKSRGRKTKTQCRLYVFRFVKFAYLPLVFLFMPH